MKNETKNVKRARGCLAAFVDGARALLVRESRRDGYKNMENIK